MNLKFAIKCGVFAAVMYVEKKNGVWGKSEDSHRLLISYSEIFRPYLDYLEKSFPLKSHIFTNENRIQSFSVRCYNSLVQSSCQFLCMTPCHMKNAVSSVSDKVRNYISS